MRRRYRCVTCGSRWTTFEISEEALESVIAEVVRDWLKKPS